MVGLRISPLRGLITFCASSVYSLFIPSGLKKLTQTVNQENMPAIFHFGLNNLFDGCLTHSEFLCDGYVINGANNQLKSLIINDFLCDGYVIGKQILFDGHLIKE